MGSIKCGDFLTGWGPVSSSGRNSAPWSLLVVVVVVVVVVVIIIIIIIIIHYLQQVHLPVDTDIAGT